MTPAQIATTRHTCKSFDPSRKITPEVMDELRTVLRFAPSSVNGQPWHFIVAESDAGRERLAATLAGGFAYNAPKVKNASQVVVFCARTDLDEAHLAAVLAQEEADGRFATPEAKQTQGNARAFYVGLHRDQLQDTAAWVDRQLYIALGNLLFAAGALGVDACPMEGIDTAALDAALGLPEKGLRSVLMVALGYRSGEDFNAKLPKSRLVAEKIFTTL
jgi:nitroreductase/dihydropteridine reductase